MIDSDKPNPFQVFGLPIDASDDDISERLRERYDTIDTVTDEQRQLYAWARRELLMNLQVKREY